MKLLLLDTHILLWWLKNDACLNDVTRALIADADNIIYISAATTWEIAIKKSLGKLDAPDNIEKIIQIKGFDPLPISLSHGETAGKLPDHHKDPFDRMLIAQAQIEGLSIVTHDSRFKLYSVDVVWVK